ncbi:MAG: alkaline phosphatase family protein [Myxococcota bacterium]|nr:alkaline phosphatase family protein [Myxococcota bacterium]
MSLLTTVVGYTTSSTSQILAIFKPSTATNARIAYQDSSGVARAVDVALIPAAPYALAKFSLKELALPSVKYAVADWTQNAPEPAAMLASPAARFFRLVKQGPLKIALVSCNDIDNHTFAKEHRADMWRRLLQLVEGKQVDLILHAGDQIYADSPPVGWLESEKHVGAYRRHYVSTWSHPDVAAVLSTCPSLMMWDDHEIYDGWGSNDNDDTAKALERYRAAEQAYREFQDPQNPPDRLAGGLGWIAKYGDLAIVAVDARSRRSWASGSVAGKEQLDDLELKLGELSQLGLKHLYLVLGTPVVNVPLIAAEKVVQLAVPSGLDDIRDGWTASKNRAECERMLRSLMTFAAHSPTTQVTLLAGDIHLGTLAQITTQLPFGRNQAKPRLFQVTASGIGRPTPRGVEGLAIALITSGGTQQLFKDTSGSLLPIHGSTHRFCIPARNFAVLDPTNGKGDWHPSNQLSVEFQTELTGPSRVIRQVLD